MRRWILCWLVLLLSGGIRAAAGDGNPTGKVMDPLATAETQALYRNLHKLAQEGVLFGHQDTLAYGVGWKADPNKLDSDVQMR